MVCMLRACSGTGALSSGQVPRWVPSHAARCPVGPPAAATVSCPRGGRLQIFETVMNGIALAGSTVGTRKDLREVFALLLEPARQLTWLR
jgi:hypothetical protein